MPAASVCVVKFTLDIDHDTVTLAAEFSGYTEEMYLEADISFRGEPLCQDRYFVNNHGIHIPFVCNAYLNPVYRIAVPIFFLISGYFLIDGSGQLGTVRICRALKKSILLTIYANIVYCIFNTVIFKTFRYSLWETLIVGGDH